MLRLAVSFREQPLRTQTFVQVRVRIGRLPTNDVVLDNLALSRHHAEVVGDDGAWVLRDLGSSNGTFVNGQRIARHTLRTGDTIGIGKFTLVATVEGPPPGERAAPPLPADETRYPWQATTTTAGPGAHLVVKRGAPTGVFTLNVDAFHIGSHKSSELRLRSVLAPRCLALIVRGLGGYSVVNVTSSPESVWRNGKPVASRAWLEDGDRLELGGVLARFQHAAVPQETA